MLDTANKQYESQLQSEKTGKATYDAGWKVEELSTLNEEGRRIVVELKVVVQSMLSDEKVDKRHKLYKIGIDLALFLKGKSIDC